MNNNLQLGLLFTRASIFLVMFMWTIMKFINPERAISIYQKFYFISGLEYFVMYAIGIVEMLILFMFLAGIKKTFTYGAVLVFHLISTVSAFKQYLSPFDGPHLLFFAAWPMLAACVLLFLLRYQDTALTVKKLR